MVDVRLAELIQRVDLIEAFADDADGRHVAITAIGDEMRWLRRFYEQLLVFDEMSGIARTLEARRSDRCGSRYSQRKRSRIFSRYFLSGLACERALLRVKVAPDT